MRVYIQGGSLKLLIPVPEPAQTVTWLKNDFKLRALRRGRDGERRASEHLLTAGRRFK
jgi:hypothetical protein